MEIQWQLSQWNKQMSFIMWVSVRELTRTFWKMHSSKVQAHYTDLPINIIHTVSLTVVTKSLFGLSTSDCCDCLRLWRIFWSIKTILANNLSSFISHITTPSSCHLVNVSGTDILTFYNLSTSEKSGSVSGVFPSLQFPIPDMQINVMTCWLILAP